MSYTDQDVEEVINAYFVSYDTSKNARGQTADASTVHCKAHEQGVRAAHAALATMEREPLENVLEGIRFDHIEITKILSADGGEMWYASIHESQYAMTDAHGTTIDEAIRNAVAAAKEGSDEHP